MIDTLLASEFVKTDYAGSTAFVSRKENVGTSVFDMEELCKVVAMLPRVCIGIVCRPDIYNHMRKYVIDAPMSCDAAFGGIRLFQDCYQREAFIPFYDDSLLRRYLQRNEKPTNDRHVGGERAAEPQTSAPVGQGENP